MAWWNGPDPYTYERIGLDRATGRPVYVCSLNGSEIGVIVPVRASTDTKIAGTRMRRPGRGRDEFMRGDSRVFVSSLTRREIADQFRDAPMTATEIGKLRDLFLSKAAS